VLRGVLTGSFGWYTRLRWRYDAIVERGQLLEQEQPEGVDGGGVLLLGAGVLYDSRDREVSTSRGVFSDVSVLAAPELPGVSRYPLVGFDAAVRGYLPLTANVVLAGRALYDFKHGSVPMFERTQYEGLVYGEGLGGSNTIRGLARARLAGEKKLLVGAELRATLLMTHWFDKVQEMGLGAGFDVGRVGDSGEAPLSAIGGYGQARITWDRAILMRIEAGYAGQDKVGWYVSFGESF
jgi:outer membrane protein assembly factor BamA